jgi:hypothetical protein
MAKLYTFRVAAKAGEHIGNKRNYKSGYTFQSRYPLDELFVGKFDRVPDEPVVVDDEDGPPKRLIPAKEEVTAPYGDIKQPALAEFVFEEASDITRLFPKAKELKLAVYKNTTGGYAVAEPEAKVKVNLADGVLGSKKQVNEFLESFQSASTAQD